MKYIFFIAFLAFSLLTFGLGLLVDDIPFLTLNREVGISDVVSLCMSLIALPVGAWLVNKWFDDRRYINNLLSDEIQSYLKVVDTIPAYVRERHLEPSQEVTEEDKNQIMLSMKEMELRMDSCLKQLESAHGRKTRALRGDFSASHDKYWKAVTNDLHDSGKRFDASFKKELDQAYHLHRLEVMLCLYKVQGL